jgi:hypothetical protein
VAKDERSTAETLFFEQSVLIYVIARWMDLFGEFFYEIYEQLGTLRFTLYQKNDVL